MIEQEPEPEPEPEPVFVAPVAPPEPEPEPIPEPEPTRPIPVAPVKTILPPPRFQRPPSHELEELVAPPTPAGQRELQLGARNDGGRFDKAEPTVVDGEDLDLPAYLRKRRKP